MKKIMVVILLFTMLTALLAACNASSQPKGEPPTEEEIAEIRRIHQAQEGSAPPASMAYPDPHEGTIAEYWIGGFDHVFIVEIIGEREIRVFERNDFEHGVRETRYRDFYPGRIIDIIAQDPDGNRPKNLNVDDDVDLWLHWHSGARMLVGEHYLVIGRGVSDGEVRVSSPVIMTTPQSFFYITNNMYIIDIVETSGVTSQTGKHLDDFRSDIINYISGLNLRASDGAFRGNKWIYGSIDIDIQQMKEQN